MTISKIDNSQRTAAKVAGWSGLLTFAIVVFGNFVLLNPLTVPGNAAATAQNIVAHETQFRLTVVCFLTYSLGVVVLLSALYVILKPLNPGLALVGALSRLVFAFLWLLSTLNMLSAVRLNLFADDRWLPLIPNIRQAYENKTHTKVERNRDRAGVARVVSDRLLDINQPLRSPDGCSQSSYESDRLFRLRSIQSQTREH